MNYYLIYIEKNNNPNYKLEYGSDKIKIDIILIIYISINIKYYIIKSFYLKRCLSITK